MGRAVTTNTHIEEAKRQVHGEVDALRPDLLRLSREIHAHPETAFQERHAHDLLAPFVREQGFMVEEQAFGLETSFRAVFGGGPVTIAFCAEYDALPEIGHACGHNLIAACGVGAAVTAARILGDRARIVLLGTPGEEGGGGKIKMLDAGAFDGVDVAMMAHPGPVDFVYANIMGSARVQVDYYGKAAHQGAMPERGVNALDAIVTAYNTMAQLRQHIRRDARLAAIVTRGGDAVNVIPEHTSGIFSARASSARYLQQLRERLQSCIEAGALATGCRVEMEWSQAEYAPFRHNHAMADAYIANGHTLGKQFLDLSDYPVGGTDMANVSQALPAIHPEFAIGAGPSVQTHTREFADATATDEAHAAMLDATRLLAMTAIDLALDPSLLQAAKDEFERGSK
jgi:amidohydrolase